MKPARLLFRTGIALLFLSSSAVADGDHIGKGAETLPLFDAHVHYKEPAWVPYPPGTVLELWDRSGVAMALVSSTPDEGTIRLWEYAPNRVIPELRPYHGDVGSSNWTRAAGIFAYIRKRMEKYPHQGIGEYHLHSINPADEPLLRRIAALAREKDEFIHVHSGKGPVDQLFSYQPGLKIIWAHAGMSEPPDVVERMMARYEKLYADTSYREGDILGAGDGIDPAWRRVLERFSDRFMVGSDTWVNGQWDDYAGIIATNRQWLSYLSRPIAEKIAYRNAERLFGRKISRDLIGKK